MPRLSRSIAILASMLCIVVAGPAMAQGTAGAEFMSLKQSVQADLDRLRGEIGFPGATAAFMLPDGRVAEFATGLADQAREIPMNTDGRIMSGSIGKTFVAALALALVNEGKLDLDDRISKWLGDESWFARLGNGEAITLRMLLNHTSGIPDYVYSPRFAKASAALFSDPDRHPKPLDLIRYSLDEAALFEPGTQYTYSDTDYLLAGLVLEKASGEDYYQAIIKRFLYPHELTRTAPSPGRYHPGLVQGHTAPDNLFNLPDGLSLNAGLWNVDPGFEWTGGGLVTNVRDLVRWASLLYSGQAMEGDYLSQLLAPPPAGVAYVDYLLAPPRTDAEKINGRGHYGLAVSVTSDGGTLSYGHCGWFPGYLSTFAYYPASGVAVAFQMNTDLGGLDKNIEGAGRTLEMARQTLITTILSSSITTR